MGRGRQALPFARRGSRNRWVAETSSTLLLRRPLLPATTHASSDGLWFLEGTAARRQGKAIVSRAIGISFTFILTMDFAIGFETSSSWALDHPPAIGTARSKPRRLRHAHVERAWGSSTLAIGARTTSAASFRRRGGMAASSWALPRGTAEDGESIHRLMAMSWLRMATASMMSPDVCPLRALPFARIAWSFMRMRMAFHANGFQAASVIFGARDIPIGWRTRLRGAKEKPLAGGADCHRRPKRRPSYAMQTFPLESILRAFSAPRPSKALGHRSSPSEEISLTMHPLLRHRDA